MRLFVLLIALCQAAEAQSIVLSGDGRSIVISGAAQQTPKSVEPVTVTEPPVRETQAVLSHTSETQQFYLVSEPWCSACPAAKARFKAKGWPKENILTTAQAKARFGFTVPYVPYEFRDPGSRATPPAEQLQQEHSCNCSSACTCGCQQRQPCRCGQAQSQPVQQRASVRYGNSLYTGRVCSNPNCKMCNQIQRGLEQSMQYQPISIQKVTPAQEGTPHDLVEQMLDVMSLGRDDILADLGCGDGRVLIAAANRGIRGIGVEIDPVVADRARRNVESAGVGHLVTIETGDVRDFDPARCTAITAYLYPALLSELSATMKSVRVVGSPYHAVPGLSMTQYGDVWVYGK